jgi:PhnB protein
MELRPRIQLAFQGDCEAAFEHYESCLGGTFSFKLRWAESPMAADAPPDWGDKLAHAGFRLGGLEIAGSDVPPGRYFPPQGFEILLDIEDPAAATQAFGALAEGGVVTLPLQQTFWAHRFGVLVDRFGIPWSINCAGPA